MAAGCSLPSQRRPEGPAEAMAGLQAPGAEAGGVSGSIKAEGGPGDQIKEVGGEVEGEGGGRVWAMGIVVGVGEGT